MSRDENFLNDIVDLIARYSRQDYAVNHWGVTAVKLAKSLFVTRRNAIDQPGLNPHGPGSFGFRPDE